MAKTLRVQTAAGWTTKPAPDIPANRLSAAEIDDNFLTIEAEKLALSGGTMTGDLTVLGLMGSHVDVSSGGTCTVNRRNRIANSSPGLTFNLPPSPSDGDRVHFVPKGNGNSYIIGRNGKTIMGLAEDLNVSNPYISPTLEFISADDNWVFSTGL